MAVIDSQLRVYAKELTANELASLIVQATFSAGDGVTVQAYQFEPVEELLRLPRGMVRFLPNRPDLILKDKRSFPILPKHEVKLELDTGEFQGQRAAVDAIKHFQQGIVRRSPGTGKTILQITAIAELGTRALVIVHTEDLLEQWIEYCKRVVPTMEVGVIQGPRCEIGQITIAMIQTLSQKFWPEEWYRQFGYVVCDEMQHLNIESSYEYFINQTTSRYRIGTSASATRSDNMHPYHEMVFGPVIHELAFESRFPVYVEKLNTEFRHRYQPTGNSVANRNAYNGLVKDIINDYDRNALVAKRTDELIRQGKLTLVLSRRIEHLVNIKSLMKEDATVLVAKGMPKQRRREIIKEFKAGTIRCILSSQLANEGLDVIKLEAVVLPYPSRFKEALLQQCGRALRANPGKTSAIIVDIVDPKQKTLNRQWDERRRAYREWGFVLKKSKTPHSRGVIIKGLKRSKVKVQYGRKK